MRTPGEGGLEKIGNIWYYTYYNLQGNDAITTGRRGHQKALDDYFGGMPVMAIGAVLRKFVNDRPDATCEGIFSSSHQ